MKQDIGHSYVSEGDGMSAPDGLVGGTTHYARRLLGSHHSLELEHGPQC